MVVKVGVKKTYGTIHTFRLKGDIKKGEEWQWTKFYTHFNELHSHGYLSKSFTIIIITHEILTGSVPL